MTRLAFYAPMKPPDHPTPSGDREMARNLIAGIAAGGAKVDLVSRLRLHDKRGDPARQAEIRQLAAAETDRLITALMGTGTRAWVTYHNYYKAPDLIGPRVCDALDLPYVQIESTRAKSRLTGPWADFARAAETACDRADIIWYLTANDLITLDRHKTPTQKLVHLPPFLPMTTLPGAGTGHGPMLCAGMMREGDKMASYTILAETLDHLQSPDWQLHIAGDGPARAEVERLMARHGARVTFLGALDRDALLRAYQAASVFVWPGVNEAFGMVYLEAEATGLPVVAQDRPGVRDVVYGDQPAPEAGPAALARRIDELLALPDLRRVCGQTARDRIATRHLAGVATEIIWGALTPLLEARL